MQKIPADLLARLQQLPEDVPSRLVINTNGKGEWKTELYIFAPCTGETVALESLLALAMAGHLLEKNT